MQVGEWEIDPNSHDLRYDRKWALVDARNPRRKLTQETNPKLCFIEPSLDLEKGTLTLTDSRGLQSSLVLSLSELLLQQQQEEEEEEEGNSTTAEAEQWVSQVIGYEAKWVIATKEIIASRGNCLVISEASLQELHNRLPNAEEAQQSIDAINFRPNVIVAGGTPFQEDKWKTPGHMSPRQQQNHNRGSSFILLDCAIAVQRQQ